ncbi:MAG TPA: hypothetical protein VGP38_10475, partial [Rubrobacter sp.]|nr:hypothetical protein [Rubrobacter sp.]
MDFDGGNGGTKKTGPRYAREPRAAGLASHTRSEFLRRAAGAGASLMAGAGLLPLAGCSGAGGGSLDDVETPSLTVGFI